MPSSKAYIQALTQYSEGVGAEFDSTQGMTISSSNQQASASSVMSAGTTLTGMTLLSSSGSTLGSRLKQVKFSPIRSTVTVPRTDNQTTDIGYSETKV